MTTAMRFHIGAVYLVLFYVVGHGETVIFEPALALNDGLVCTVLLVASVYQFVRGCDKTMTAIETRRAG